MPPKNNSLPPIRRRRAPSAPPPVMTWAKATPVLVVGGVFDLLRLFCQMFWFFGPALAAVYCAVNVSDTLSNWSFGFFGAKTAIAICALIAGSIGAAAVEATAPLGVIMAMAVGFAGWITIGGWLLMTNSRIFKENTLSFVLSLAVSEAPLLGSAPALTFALWRMYGTQIRLERAAFKKYEEEQRALQTQEQQQLTARITHMQIARQVQTQQEALAQEETNYEQLIQQQAANDAQYEIPEEGKMAA